MTSVTWTRVLVRCSGLLSREKNVYWRTGGTVAL
jgi:hypothetical protein